MAVLTLLGLPSELTTEIIDLAAPGDHLSFALTCRRFYEESERILAYHRSCYQEYTLSSDLLPLTLPKLLRKVLTDPVAAWHVRDLEFWGLKPRWKSWRTYHFEDWLAKHKQDDEPDFVHVDASELGQAGHLYSEEDVSRMKALLDVYVPGYKANEWTARLSLGDEEPLRLLLFAITPRLRSLNFPIYQVGRFTVTTAGAYIRPDPSGTAVRDPLGILCQSIETFASISSALTLSPWPPGFCALRSIAVGFDNHLPGHYLFHYLFASVTPLFLLPCLETIHLERPHYDVNPNKPRTHLPAGKSSVKNIHLYKSELNNAELEELIIGVATLKSFTLETSPYLNPFRESFEVIPVLESYHGRILEHLEICVPRIPGRYHCHYYSMEVSGCLKLFTNLKHLSIDVMALLYPHCTYGVWHFPDRCFLMRKRDGKIESVDFAATLPKSIRSVNFMCGDHGARLTKEVAEPFDEAVAKMIHAETLSNLKIILFNDLMPARYDRRYDGCYDEELDVRDNLGKDRLAETQSFHRSLAAGMRRGVEVLTAWTHSEEETERRKDEIGVLRPMAQAELKTDVRKDVAGFRSRAEEARKEVDLMRARIQAEGYMV